MSRGPSATQRLALLLVAAAVPVTLVTVNVRLLASAAYLRWEYGRAHFPAAPGFTADERLAVAVPSTVFILGDTPPAALAALRRGDAPLYTESEIAHLVDVQRRVRILLAAGAFGAVAVGIALAAAAWGRARRWGSSWWSGSASPPSGRGSSPRSTRCSSRRGRGSLPPTAV